jgi:hypothetical protein
LPAEGKGKGQKKVVAHHALKGQKILTQGVCVFRNKMKPSAPRIKERKASSFLENSERIAWGGHFTTKKSDNSYGYTRKFTDDF